MAPCVRTAVAFFLLSILANGAQECGDADCEFNVQLLQQDVTIQKDVSPSAAKKTHETATTEVRVASLAEQTTDAFAQFNKMISEDRAKGEVRLADRMGTSSKHVAKKTQGRANPEIVAYSSKTGCGLFGLNKNEEWCGWSRPRFHVKKSFNCIQQVFTDVCASGIAKFMSLEGDDTADSVQLVDGCSYRFYAQYECLDVIIADLDVENNYTYLKELEKNLTDMIHEQAIVISKTTDKYLAAQEVEDSTDAASDALEDDLDTAETKEAIYGTTHDYHSYAVYQKKQELEALQNATDETNETLQIVKPKYLAAEAAYQAALGPEPYVDKNAEDARKEAEEAEAALAAADQAQAAADLAVENMTMRLQKEVKKLNDKNDELRGVQKELDRPLPKID